MFALRIVCVVVEILLCGVFEELGVLTFAFVDFVQKVLLFADQQTLLFDFLHLKRV
jgi:hypothetical protein